MPSPRIQDRLTKLEVKSSAAKRIEEHAVFIAALPSETDIEAIQIRLDKPKQSKYRVVVIRRSGRGFETNSYDEVMKMLYEHPYVPHPDEYFESLRDMSKADMTILWRCYHKTVCRVDGRDPYRAVLA